MVALKSHHRNISSGSSSFLLYALLFATTTLTFLLPSSLFDLYSTHQFSVQAESIPSYYSKRYVFGQDVAIKSRKLSSYHNVSVDVKSVEYIFLTNCLGEMMIYKIVASYSHTSNHM